METLMKLEPMADFFAARVEGYDEHMLSDVEGCAEGYPLMASLIPHSAKRLLDLGCGTGLELDEIFKRHPHLAVTGIDLCAPMLERLKQKHGDKNLNLIQGDYFSVDLGSGYDCAVSFESLHHFPHGEKTVLYKRIFDALNENGVYLECDYMVDDPAEEEFYFAQLARYKGEQNLGEGYYHYDTPCTVEHQKMMLNIAGFSSVRRVFRKGGTCMLLAEKGVLR